MMDCCRSGRRAGRRASNDDIDAPTWRLRQQEARGGSTTRGAGGALSCRRPRSRWPRPAVGDQARWHVVRCWAGAGACASVATGRAAGRKIALRATRGTSRRAGRARKENMAFAIGASGSPACGRPGLDRRGRWRDAIDMENAQVAVRVSPGGLAGRHGAAHPRVSWTPARFRDPRSRRRAPCTRSAGMLFRNWSKNPHLRYSFICTNLDVSPRQGRRRRALVPAPHLHREHLPRLQAGAALRHLPPATNRSTPRGCGLADRRRDGRLAAPAHRADPRRRAGGRPRHPRRQAMIATCAGSDRHPGPAGAPRRPADLRLAPGADLLPAVLAAIRACPHPPASPAPAHPRRHPTPGAPSHKTAAGPHPQEGQPANRRDIGYRYPGLGQATKITTGGRGSSEPRTLESSH